MYGGQENDSLAWGSASTSNLSVEMDDLGADTGYLPGAKGITLQPVPSPNPQDPRSPVWMVNPFGVYECPTIIQCVEMCKYVAVDLFGEVFVGSEVLQGSAGMESVMFEVKARGATVRREVPSERDLKVAEGKARIMTPIVHHFPWHICSNDYVLGPRFLRYVSLTKELQDQLESLRMDYRMMSGESNEQEDSSTRTHASPTKASDKPLVLQHSFLAESVCGTPHLPETPVPRPTTSLYGHHPRASRRPSQEIHEPSDLSETLLVDQVDEAVIRVTQTPVVANRSSRRGHSAPTSEEHFLGQSLWQTLASADMAQWGLTDIESVYEVDCADISESVHEELDREVFREDDTTSSEFNSSGVESPALDRTVSKSSDSLKAVYGAGYPQLPARSPHIPHSPIVHRSIRTLERTGNSPRLSVLTSTPDRPNVRDLLTSRIRRATATVHSHTSDEQSLSLYSSPPRARSPDQKRTEEVDLSNIPEIDVEAIGQWLVFIKAHHWLLDQTSPDAGNDKDPKVREAFLSFLELVLTKRPSLYIEYSALAKCLWQLWRVDSSTFRSEEMPDSYTEPREVRLAQVILHSPACKEAQKDSKLLQSLLTTLARCEQELGAEETPTDKGRDSISFVVSRVINVNTLASWEEWVLQAPNARALEWRVSVLLKLYPSCRLSSAFLRPLTEAYPRVALKLFHAYKQPAPDDITQALFNAWRREEDRPIITAILGYFTNSERMRVADLASASGYPKEEVKKLVRR